MAEPDNQTLHLLRELRTQIGHIDTKIDYVHDDLGQRIENLQQAMIGESVLGRYNRSRSGRTARSFREASDASRKKLTL